MPFFRGANMSHYPPVKVHTTGVQFHGFSLPLASLGESFLPRLPRIGQLLLVRETYVIKLDSPFLRFL